MKIQEKEVKFNGKVIQVLAGNGHCIIARVINDKEEITVQGSNEFQLNLNVKYQFTGYYESYNLFERRFVFTRIIKVEVPSRKEVVKLLKNSLHNVRSKEAHIIVDKLGCDCLNKIKADRNVLQQFHFLDEVSIFKFYKYLIKNESKIYFELIMYRYGFSKKQIRRIWSRYSKSKNLFEIVNIIETNPYSLMNEVKGMKFNLIDSLALSKGLSVKSSSRIRAVIEHILNYEIKNDIICLPEEVIYRRLSKYNLSISIEEFSKVIVNLCNCNTLVNIEGDIYLYSIYKRNYNIAQYIKRIRL